MSKRSPTSPRLFTAVGGRYTPRFDAKMTVQEVIEAHYIPYAAERLKKSVGKQLSPGRIERMNYIARLLGAYLHRPATIFDLNPETLDKFYHWHGAAFPKNHGNRLATDCRSLLLFCRVLPESQTKRGPKPRPLSQEKGTLWALCLNVWFPHNLLIRTEKTKAAYRRAIADLCEVIGRDALPADLTAANIAAVGVVATERGACAKTVKERLIRLERLGEYVERLKAIGEPAAAGALPPG